MSGDGETVYVSPLTYPIALEQVLDGQHWAPLHYQRLLSSRWRVEAMKPENREAAVFGFLLWFESLRQDPPGTLPEADDELAMIAGLGADMVTWTAVKEFALRGWDRCQIADLDGELQPGMRLFHPFVMKVAVEASKRKRGASARRAAGSRAVKKTRVKKMLVAMKTLRGDPPEDALDTITDWLIEGDLHATQANVKLGWDHYIGRTGQERNSM